MGEELWDKARKKNQLPKQSLHALLEDFRCQTAQELLTNLGSGDIQISTVLQHLQALNEEPEEPKSTQILANVNKAHAPVKPKGSIEGVGNTLTTLARCCKPIPGDPIIGYVTKGLVNAVIRC